MQGRLATHAGRAPVTFVFDDRPIVALEGDTIAAALYAAGVRTFTRSFKYHRPRGLFCGAGRCANCLMNVDGEPNVRTCVTPARDGMRVRHQNAWPSLETDALAVLGRAERFLPVGFYYRTMIRPRALWPLYERALRAVAGLGVVDPTTHPEGYHHEYRTTDIVIVGGGPAGMAAALAAARTGQRVLLIEEGEALGGAGSAGVWPASASPNAASPLPAPTALAAAGVAIWTGAVAFGAYEGRLLGVQRGRTLAEVRYRRLVLATGAFEPPALFGQNDLPGIMLGTAARRLLRAHGVRPGRRAVIAAAHDDSLALAEELADAGVEVAAVLDIRSAPSEGAERLAARGIECVSDASVVRALGRGRLAGVEAAIAGADLRRIPCDVLLLSLGWEPDVALLAQIVGAPHPTPGDGIAPGAPHPDSLLRWDDARGVWCAGEGEGEILAAGSVTGAATLEECLAQGEAAGRAAAEGQPAARSSQPADERQPVARSEGRFPYGPRATGHGLSFICLCEDVTEKDIARAIEEGFDHIETLKRYSTASMGPCQGKLCRAAVSELCARLTGRTPEGVGVSRARPPARPVTLGALGAAHDAPVRRTPMHHRHTALGARFFNLGEWKRPEVYTSVAEECRAVRERVGLIDVSTLGKLEVTGKDVVPLLEKVYPNRCGDLRPGRVRYGVICDDAGIILDDGTIARVIGRGAMGGGVGGLPPIDAPDRWFLTTTTGGIEAMDQWLRWWAVPGPGGAAPEVQIANVTAALAAVNLAGPRSREVLAPLVDVDLSPRAFPYLGAREGALLGIPALFLRIGFVGELGYEIHFAAEYGAAVWDALLEAGRPYGIRPFGVEAQRVLRLEKQHVIVGHDTDALSNPLDAGIPWIVKWEKEDFVGRPSLVRLRRESGSENGARQRLVGFEIADPSLALPEGCQVVEEGRPVGRVTSFRQSPTLRRGIGLAWVPDDAAREGARIQIAAPAGQVPAVVTLKPFYDPEGLRVRG
jgi:sarcosine oxidase subunit alpha